MQNNHHNYCYFDSPMGKMLIASNEQGLAGVWFDGQKHERKPADNWTLTPKDALLKKSIKQLGHYMDGNLEDFNLPLSLGGTPFQQKVWQALTDIRFGDTITYGQLAQQIGQPSAVRAAAAAVGRNPASIIVPCHRVVGSNGKLTGYAGGLERKRHLLELESANNDLLAPPAASDNRPAPLTC